MAASASARLGSVVGMVSLLGRYAAPGINSTRTSLVVKVVRLITCRSRVMGVSLWTRTASQRGRAGSGRTPRGLFWGATRSLGTIGPRRRDVQESLLRRASDELML